MEAIRLSEEHGGRVARLVLEAPPDQALTIALLQELESALDALGRWPDLACLVVEGTARDFCTGLAPAQRRRPYAAMLLRAWHSVARRLASLEAVRVAKVRGRCLGAGCELALLCHQVWADRTGKMGFPEISIGAFPTVAPLLLAARTGETRAAELMLSGREIDAAEAQGLGLANACASGWEDLDALSARLLERDVLSRSTVALRAMVRAMRPPAFERLEDDLLDAEKLYLSRVTPSQDAEEGLSAALHRRTPVWKHA